MAQQQAPIKQQALDALKYGKEKIEKLAEKLPIIHTYEQNEINILGEEVALTPTGINKSFKQIVEFDDYYKPNGISEEDLVVLKNTMRILFDNTYKKVLDVESGEEDQSFTLEKKFPPCDEKQKELILQSLVYRKNRLLEQLAQLGIQSYEDIRKGLRRLNEKDKELQGKETLLARQYLQQFYKLQQYIDNYNTHTLCISTDDKAFKGVKVDLDDDKIRELLKQYVFFILQGQHPLEDYKKTDPTSSQFVARLAKKPLGEQFPIFMDKYKKQQFPIPEPIAKILESTEISPGAMKAMIDQQVFERTQEIIKYIKTILPSTHPFYKRFPKLEKETDLKSVLDELLKLLKDCEDNGQLLEKEKKDLEGKQKTLEQALANIKKQKNDADRRVADIEALLVLQQGNEAQIVQLKNEKTALEELRDEKEHRIGELTGQITTVTQQKDALTATVARLNQQKTADDATIDGLRQQKTTDDTTIDGLRQQKTVDDATIDGLRQQKTTDDTTISNLRQEIQQLQQTIATDVDTLRKQLAQVTAAKTAAEEAATKAAADAQTSVAAKQAELDQARTAIQTANVEATRATARIADLERQLNEATNRLQQQQETVTKATEEASTVRAQLVQGQQQVAKLEEDIAKVTQRLEGATESTDTLQQELDRLQNELQKVKTENADLKPRLQACEESKKLLESGASVTTQEVDRLKTEKAKIEGERDIARQEVQRLQTDIGSLQTTIRDQVEQLKAQGIKISELQKDSLIKNQKLESQKQLTEDATQYAASAEERARKIQQSKDDLVTQLEQTYRKGIQDIKADFDEAIDERDAARDEITKKDAELAQVKQQQTDEIRKCNDSLAQQTDEIRKRNAELAQVKQQRNSAVALSKEKQALEQAVLAIASGQTDIPQVGEQQTQSALAAIVQKLKTPAKVDPLAALKEQKRESPSIIRCYYVFLMSFLWQTNFPTLVLGKPTSEEKQMYNMYYSIFHQGPDPAVTGGKLGIGLYETLIEKPAKEGFPKNNIDIIKEYFSILQILGRVLMTADYNEEGLKQLKTDGILVNGIIQKVSLNYIKELIKQIESIATFYTNAGKLTEKPVGSYTQRAMKWLENLNENTSSAATTTSSSAATTSSSSAAPKLLSFADYTAAYLLDHQPRIDPDLFDRRIVIEGDKIKLGTTGNLSYPVLFYCFLMLLRDYLNSIQNTDTETSLCHLPTFLQIKK